MRVYNVTKQGHDQDPSGRFIRKYVPELTRIPNEYIHEPNKMPTQIQLKYKILIGHYSPSEIPFLKETSVQVSSYPAPIVDEKETAKVSRAERVI